MAGKIKEYEIDSFKKLCNVINKDNFESLSADLLKWLALTVNLSSEYRKKHPEETKNLSNWDILRPTFIWIDDGKTNLDYVMIKNPETGERTKIKISC